AAPARRARPAARGGAVRRLLAALRRAVGHPWQLAWLWLVWMLLWARLSVLTAVGGLVVAIVVLAAFPSPPPEAAAGPGRPRPARACLVAARLLAELLPASVTIARQLFRHGRATPAAIVAVPLRTSSEVVAALIADAVSLGPGAAVIHVDRERGYFYVHALTPGGQADVDAVRARVDDLQRQVIRALGHEPVGRGPAGQDSAGQGPAGPERRR
ncbi:Na+/H+ antiporter subunit E, partial [Frankia sp. CNm7]